MSWMPSIVLKKLSLDDYVLSLQVYTLNIAECDGKSYQTNKMHVPTFLTCRRPWSPRVPGVHEPRHLLHADHPVAAGQEVGEWLPPRLREQEAREPHHRHRATVTHKRQREVVCLQWYMSHCEQNEPVTCIFWKSHSGRLKKNLHV